MNKKNIGKKKDIEEAFRGVWGEGPKKVLKARTLQLAGKRREAKKLFGDALKEMEKEKAKTTEKDFPYQLKYNAWLAETNALISLINGTVKGISKQDPTADFKKAAMHYNKLERALDALAGSCSSCEDMAQVMFEGEAEVARKIAEGLKEKLGKKKIKPSAKVKKIIVSVLSAWSEASGNYGKSENAGTYSSRGSEQVREMLECVKEGDYSGASKAYVGGCSDFWDAGYDWSDACGGYSLRDLDKVVGVIRSITAGKAVSENFLNQR